MQKVEFNKETGNYEMVNIDGSAISTDVAVAEPPVDEAVPTTYLELIQQRAKRRQIQEDQVVENEINAASRGEDDRPVFAQDVGMFARDAGRIAANAGVSLVTDYVDLGLGVADVVGQTAQILTGQRNGYNPDDIFNDADNPLTKWRREAFKTETVAGQAASNLVRLGTALVTLPKTAIKGIAAPTKILAKAPGIGKTFGKVGNALTKADDALKASRAPKVTKAMEALELGSKGGRKAAQAVAKNDWLTYTFKDIAKSAETANWWKGVSNSAAALTSIKKVKGTKAKIRTVGEALGWDAFVAFNVFGEGQDDFDETLTDFLAENNLPRLSYFETDVLDSSVERKWKQMLEGVITAAPMSAMIDMIRIRKFAKAFKSASDADKVKIVEAFNGEAERLGRGINDLIFEKPQGPVAPTPQGFDPYGLYRQRGGALSVPTEGGALATLNTQSDLVKLADQNVTALEGLQSVSGQIVDQSVNPVSVNGAPQGLLSGSQSAGDLPGFAPGTGLIGESPQAVNAQIAATRAGQAPVPTFGRGSESLEGNVIGQGLIGESPQATNARIAAVRAGQAPAPAFGNSAPIAANDLTAGNYRLADGPYPSPNPAPVPEWPYPKGPSSPVPGKPAPMPEWSGVTPRNPDPVFSPLAIRSAFEEDAAAVFKQAVVLGSDELLPAQMKQVAEQVEDLMPKTRVDAITYLEENPITPNELGIIEASESVWSNFIVNRGLFEGWAKIGDDMQIRFLRNPAANLDRGELAEKSAKALDEAVDNELFNENVGRLIVNNNSDAVVDAKLKNNVLTTKAGEERYAVGEELRLSQAEEAAIAGASSDEDVVRQALSVELDDIKGPDVEKVEGSRGWVMLSEDGEELGRFTRKSQALKAAEKETDRLKAEAINKARQIEADGMEQVLQTADINPVYTSDLTANVKLSKAQVDELLRYSDVVRKQIRINKNTYTFSQGEMYDLIDGLTALKQTGEMKGNRLRVINNLIDKLDTQMKLLSPAARAIKQAQDLAVDAGRFLKNGEFC